MKRLEFRFLILLMFVISWQGCRVRVKYVYSPLEPRVGQKVYFSNDTKGSYRYDWDFGDGTTSSMENAVKIYDKPGVYNVRLRISGRYSGERVEEIVVRDTLPGIVSDIEGDTSFGIPIFRDIAFSVSMYKLSGLLYDYSWSFSTDDYETMSLCDSVCKVYFRGYSDSIGVRVCVTERLGGESFMIERRYSIRDTLLPSLLYRDSEGDKRIRLYSTERRSLVGGVNDVRQVRLLDSTLECKQVYNGVMYDTSVVSDIVGEAVVGFIIHKGKIYYRTNDEVGVINIDGGYRHRIVSVCSKSLCIDYVLGCLYWSVGDSIMSLPLVRSWDNRLSEEPRLLMRTGVPIEKLVYDSVYGY